MELLSLSSLPCLVAQQQGPRVGVMARAQLRLLQGRVWQWRAACLIQWATGGTLPPFLKTIPLFIRARRARGSFVLKNDFCNYIPVFACVFSEKLV